MTIVLGIVLFILLYRFIKQLGKSFPLFELVSILFLLQCVIAPMIEYDLDPMNTMAIPKEDYLMISSLSCYALILGLFSIKNKFSISRIDINSEVASKFGRIFLAIGVISSMAMLFLPESLRSIVNFFILFQSIGVYALIYSDNKLDKFLAGGIFLTIALTAIIDGLLIGFIVFSIFFLMFFTLKYKLALRSKFIIVIAGLLFITVYQGVKREYRKFAWVDDMSSIEKLALLSELITLDSFTALFTTKASDNDTILETVHRLNQGWQTSMVYDHVPRVVEFQNGKDLINDIFSSIMPRFLWPNKRTVNDPDRFMRFTGYELNEITSMSIGVLGDFYVNFGFYGSLFPLYLFGVFLAFLQKWFYKNFIKVNAINLIWLPFIFSYLIRPGNEFYMVFNHLLKALIVFYLVRKFIYPYLMKNLILDEALD